MIKARKKRKDDVEVTVYIPKKVLVEYCTEHVSPFQPKSSCRRYVEFLVSNAIFERFLKVREADSLGQGTDAV